MCPMSVYREPTMELENYRQKNTNSRKAVEIENLPVRAPTSLCWYDIDRKITDS